MTDAELLSRLAAAVKRGQADVALAARLQSHIDFPGNSETDNGQFILVAVLLTALAFWLGHFPGAGVAVAVLAAAYWFWWRKIVQKRVRQRFIAKAMTDLKLWRKSWAFNGIALMTGEVQCLSPKGDWRAFAAALEKAPPPAAR